MRFAGTTLIMGVKPKLRSIVQALAAVALLGVVLVAPVSEAVEDIQPVVPTNIPDQMPAQVQLEVIIFEVNTQATTDLGVNFRFDRLREGVDGNGIVERLDLIPAPTASLPPGFVPPSPVTNVISDINHIVSMPRPDSNPWPDNVRPDIAPAVPSVQTPAGLGVAADVISGEGTFFAALRTLLLDQQADLISRPAILVMDGERAEIHAGGEVPFQDIQYTKGIPRLQVKYEKTGVDVILTPTITDDGRRVRINIELIAVRDVAISQNVRGVQLPRIADRTLRNTTIIVPDGHTWIAGGLRSESKSEVERRIPVLGSIPLLGNLFKSRSTVDRVRELYIAMVPRIILPNAPVPAMDYEHSEEALEEAQRRIEVNF